MALTRQRLTPDDRECFDLLEYQVGKIMDETVNEQFPTLVHALVEEGHSYPDKVVDRRAELELITEDLVRLPDGGFAQLYYGLRPVAEDQVREYTGMTLEQWRQERDQ